VSYLVGSASVESALSDKRKKFLFSRIIVIAINSAQESTMDYFDTVPRPKQIVLARDYLWHWRHVGHSKSFLTHLLCEEDQDHDAYVPVLAIGID
jgi:hypothetical protein